jgi:hypothetical protein
MGAAASAAAVRVAETFGCAPVEVVYGAEELPEPRPHGSTEARAPTRTHAQMMPVLASACAL